MRLRDLDIEIGNMPDDDVKVALADDGASDDGPKIGVYLVRVNSRSAPAVTASVKIPKAC